LAGNFSEVFPKSESLAGETILSLRNITGKGFHNVSLDVRKGEIVGLAGLIGSGRTETMMGVYGATRIESGEMIYKGVSKYMNSPKEAISKGFALLPEDRKNQGLILSLPVKNNIDLPSLKHISSFSVINEKKDNDLVEKAVEELKIKTPGIYQVVLNLSGGNQQKVVVGKWLAVDSELLVFDEPTKGIDVSAKQEIYILLDQLKQQGKAIVLISSDMEEIMGMSDRMYVFYEGTISGEIHEKKDFDKNLIMQYASGL